MLTPPTVLSSDPLATLVSEVAHRATRVMPSPADLVAIAIADTDFQGEITAHCDVMYLAAEFADHAAEIWEDESGEMFGTVAPKVIEATRALLILHAIETLDDMAEALADAQAERRDAGGRYGVDCDYT
jgi:hypothetical protein